MSKTWGMHTWCDTHDGLVVEPQNHPALRIAGFAEFVPQNSVATVLEGTDGGTWRHSEGCFTAKQLHVERVAVGLKA
jgi:hypothetical protein